MVRGFAPFFCDRTYTNICVEFFMDFWKPPLIVLPSVLLAGPATKFIASFFLPRFPFVVLSRFLLGLDVLF